MPELRKRRRVNRPTVLVTKTQFKQKYYSNNSRNLWYEKFRATKANNNALARALSKEKQDNQYLFTQNVELTRQLQDIEVLVNNRDEVISGILKNSSEALKLLVQATNCVTSTIVACQTIVGSHSQSINLQSSTSINTTNLERRESVRRSAGKSPARGVVQPMVSGHTITKPVINLSRINMPRIRTSPNLSVINESIGSDDTPELNPIVDESNSPRRISVNRLNGITNRSIDRLLPERMRLTSPRMSDKSEQSSERQNSRLSSRLSRGSRNSRRLSRKSNSQQPASIETSLVTDDLQITINSPRVTLQDVSRLLHNSQSINIRTLMKSSEVLMGQKKENMRDRSVLIENDNNIIISETQNDGIVHKNSAENSNESENSSPTYNFDPRKKKFKKKSNNRAEDPLEGPSWLYNPLQSVDSSVQNRVPEVIDSTESSSTENSSPGQDTKSSRESARQISKLNPTGFTNSITEPSASFIGIWEETYCNDTKKIINSNEDNESVKDAAVDLDESDKCENLTNFVTSLNLKKDVKGAYENDRLMQSPNNITRERGHSEIDDDDFTMIFSRSPKRQTRNTDFDINELNLPVLERPLINPVEVEPEPEITTTINMITQAYQPMPSVARENTETSLMENDNAVLIPTVRESIFPTPSDLDLTIPNISENDDTENTTSLFFNGPHVRKRKRLIRNRIDSSSDSEPSLTPKKIPTIRQKNTLKKDPSAAKVVLEKLEGGNFKKTPSLTSRFSSNNFSNFAQSDAQSDSEGSNTSSMMSSGRPRRQKAPINLKEPKLGTKLRR